MFETLLSVCLGIGLSAAVGFRIFVPFLMMNLAARAGYLGLTGEFEWIAGNPALLVFALATALEVGAYYIPWLDNLMDVIATPVAVIAGVLVTASVVTGMDPILKWTLAVIAGGGIAGAVQALTVGTRGASTLATGGLGNPLVAAGEMAGSVLLTLAALVIPWLAAVGVLVVLVWAVLRRARRRSGA